MIFWHITARTRIKKINPGEIMVTYGNLHRGFLYPMLKFAVITESDIFGVKKKKKEKKSHYQGQRISDFAQLKPGDYVVHGKLWTGNLSRNRATDCG